MPTKPTTARDATGRPQPKKPAEPAKFVPATAKLMIGSLDNPGLTISAQYNPREVTITQGSNWKTHDKKETVASNFHVEFATTQPRAMTVELLFDGYETHGQLSEIAGVNGDERGHKIAREGRTVEETIAMLQQLVNIRENNPRPEDVRPHFCVVVWGQHGVPTFTCVIESLTTKYQVFSSTGRVLRATCTIQLKEACRVDREDAAPLNQDYGRRQVAATRRLRMLGLPDPEKTRSTRG